MESFLSWLLYFLPIIISVVVFLLAYRNYRMAEKLFKQAEKNFNDADEVLARAMRIASSNLTSLISKQKKKND